MKGLKYLVASYTVPSDDILRSKSNGFVKISCNMDVPTKIKNARKSMATCAVSNPGTFYR